MVICGQCKYKNTIGHVFCTKCGAKLDVEAAAVKQQADARRMVFKARAIRFLLLDVVILLIVSALLIFWPSGEKAECGDDRQFHAAKIKITALEKEMSHAENFSEAEVNAVLLERLAKKFEETGLIVDIRISPGSVRLTARSGLGPWNLGTFSVGPMPFTYSVSGAPSRENNRFVFIPKTAAIGHLPLFGPLVSKASKPIARLFEGKDKMRAFMDRVKQFDIGDGTVTLKMTEEAR